MDMFYRVYTPPCYESNLNQRYPVLYLIHGQSYTDDQWDRLGMDETADRLISAGEISPLIIVMPRDRIWVPPPEDAFGESLITELIPEIDLQYRTRAKREYRAIGGLSRGGNWALHLGLQHWELFSTIGAHSTPSFVVDGPNRVRGWLEAIPQSRLPRIFMDVGESDRWLEQVMNLEAVIGEAGVPHEWYLYPGYHEEEYWESHVEQ
jgi:enterochelin esterase-like enzyme